VRALASPPTRAWVLDRRPDPDIEMAKADTVGVDSSRELERRPHDALDLPSARVRG